MVEQPPFRDVDEALKFLFDPNRVSCDRPPAARMADKRRGEPGPLAGLDGVAESGTAEVMLKGRLTPLQFAILAARYAPNKMRCGCKSDCCSGWRTNPQWRQAIDYLASEALYKALPDCDAMYMRFVAAVLLREYGRQKIALTDVGADLGLAMGTCSKYKRRILDWLLRPMTEPDAAKNSKDGPPAPPGKEVIAKIEAEQALRLGGFIE